MFPLLFPRLVRPLLLLPRRDGRHPRGPLPPHPDADGGPEEEEVLAGLALSHVLVLKLEGALGAQPGKISQTKSIV